MPSAFLPVTADEMRVRGWSAVDFAFVSGDAYVDHASFAVGLLTRVLEHAGYKVGVIAQPDWKDPGSMAVFGRPRLGFFVSGGNMDSMVNHYTVAKKPRSSDAYSPGGRTGLRPNHPTVVYSNLIRRTFKDVPIVVGGIEASLRRLAHYDYWADKLRRSILLDSGADLVLYGMGERSVLQVADALAGGLGPSELTFIDGSVYKARTLEGLEDAVVLPAFEELQADKLKYAESFAVQYRNSDPFSGKRLVEEYPHRVYVVQNPPQKPLSQRELDAVYELPYANTYHPMYEAAGGVPAIKEVKFSLSSTRGCFGECSFCAIAFHQGRIVQSRSAQSLVAEARRLTREPDFKGYIHDVGGPTANFTRPACDKQLTRGACVGKRCLAPEPCRHLVVDHSGYVETLRAIRAVPGVKKVFVRSGVRFDYVMADPDDTFISELARYHVSGQLRVAPEHVSDAVLSVMGKPKNAVYQAFCEKFAQANDGLGLKQYVVPYLMSSHPGSTLKEAVELAEYCRDLGYMPEQVQDFYPTPSTMSTVMYYTGVDPRTMKPVYVPKSSHEKAMQRALIQYRNPANYELVEEALRRAGRTDLIGFGPKCLIRPRTGRGKGTGPGRSGGAGGTAPKGAKPSGARGSSGTAPRGDKGARPSGANGAVGAKASKGSKGGQPRESQTAGGKPQQAKQRPNKGMGPNKASGHKGGMGRQGSKR